jgi:hypothetical protein
MPRVPLLSGTRLVVANAPDDAIVLLPPRPGRATDAAAATREALRFPLDGEPLEALARGAKRVTIVLQSPALPIQSPVDPRPRVVAAVSHALEGIGIPTTGQTLLVACGLARRASQRDVTTLVTPELARSFRGKVSVHDAADPALVLLDDTERPAISVARDLLETDLVVVLSAAETVLHGGPATLLAAANAEAQRRATADSLLETSGSKGWRLATRLERALTARVPVFGVSLLLNHPQPGGGPLRGYPYDADAVERIASRAFRLTVSTAPDPLRRRVLRSLRAERTTVAVLAGPPSVAHAEALLRGIELKHATLPEPLDAIVLAVPGSTPLLPREPGNPLTVTHAALVHRLGLWRDAFPVTDGGAMILVDRFRRSFTRPTQLPYLAFFRQTPIARSDELLAAAEETAASDVRGIEEYRAGRTVHPLLPFRDWDACGRALERLGSVYVAGARDGAAVRQLGFVPIGGVGGALQMVRGQRGDDARIGFLLAPPYFPLKVGG